MPIFIDRHDVPGLTARDAAEVHAKDIEVQHIFDCSTMTYWIDEDRDNAFCLVEAPNKEAVIEMHNKAHGMVPNEIIEVDTNMIMAFLGRIQDPVSQDVSGTSELSIFCDPAFRCILVTDLKDRDLLPHLNGEELHSKFYEEFIRQVRKSIQDYKGRPVDHYDEFIASFSSVTHAVECAVNISERMSALFRESKFRVTDIQIGLSCGIPVTANKNLFGDTIELGKNMKLISHSGKIIAAPEIKDLYKGNNPGYFNDSGDIKVLNREEVNFLTRLTDELDVMIDKQQFKLAYLIKKLGISQPQLYRKVTKLTGMSPAELLNEIRLQKALHSLVKEKNNISETSYSLGYSNPSYFTKCFKKRFSITPGEIYRHQ